jgi:hypothetical protein
MDDLFIWGIKFALCFFSILSFMLLANDWYKDEQAKKGRAISHYLFEMHSLEIPPEQARFLGINANTYDVSIKELEIFAK